ncbi:MAG: hypothetical protein M1825_005883 [Sarcosagium campestre]|nr:MAG: hypothetical protein M1825_005883 [Sarcosagium campestre]
MPLSDYWADLNRIAFSGNFHQLFPDISQLDVGDESGQFSLIYVPINKEVENIEIKVQVQGGMISRFMFMSAFTDKRSKDISYYPASHQYTLQTTSDDIPSAATEALVDVAEMLAATSLEYLLFSICRCLNKALDPNVEQLPRRAYLSDISDFNYGRFEPIKSLDDEELVAFGFPRTAPSISSGGVELERQKPKRLISDLRIARDAGFKVSIVGGPYPEQGKLYLSISCRISRLGISDEAMDAWGLKRDQYLILLLHYPSKYAPIEDLIKVGNWYSVPSVSMRVVVSGYYKPTMAQAQAAFSARPERSSRRSSHEGDAEASRGQDPDANFFQSFYMSEPLNALLKDRLLRLLRSRVEDGLDWNVAEKNFDFQQLNARKDEEDLNKYQEEEPRCAGLAEIITSDHFRGYSAATAATKSFPLVAAQFLLRHVVRCVEYCLVCHCKVKTNFAALKPYVCAKPLCLYQYMSLGFGSSIEHEIKTRPVVVDLLISLCYFSASAARLKDFPDGMDLRVPPPNWTSRHMYDTRFSKPFTGHVDHLVVKVDEEPYGDPLCPVVVGDWISIAFPYYGPCYQCRVVAVFEDGRFRICPPFGWMEYTIDFEEASKPVRFCVFSERFDDLERWEKRWLIRSILDTVPPVAEIKAWLSEKRHESASLRDWTARISPAALGLLRWIVASNRSYIVLVDNKIDATSTSSANEQRIEGFPGWLQFRFAQGAPDKEQRFVQALGTVENSSGVESIFAWHGSALENWHGIVREGFNFDRCHHGRKYGDGCYYTLDFDIAQGYALRWNYFPPWPSSMLGVRTILSLNEIVNRPKDFVKSRPHIVVSQLDWIQTRYLFVELNKPRSNGSDLPSRDLAQVAPTTTFLNQDIDFRTIGISGDTIRIPQDAIPRNRKSMPRHPALATGRPVQMGRKRRKVESTAPVGGATESLNNDNELTNGGDGDGDGDSDDSSSVDTSPSDEELLLESQYMLTPGCEASTDFTPGTLDWSTLPLLTGPKSASVATTQTLLRAFRAVLAVQTSYPQSELGWFIDPAQFDNVYQWIVELHSPDPASSLAIGMKIKGVSSIVMELRFGNDYPATPPFVRVIRPRFRRLKDIDGGRVSPGGALCMELLTSSGWTAAVSMESLLVHLRTAVFSAGRRTVKLDPESNADYTLTRALRSYVYFCRKKGWQVPPDLWDIPT